MYQQEVRADLGDSMVQSSAARLRAAETEYAIALTWARLEALTGEPPERVGPNVKASAEQPQ